MRLLLDHNVSGRRAGTQLAARGHDVRALDQEPAFAGLPDDEVLRLAFADERITVTHDVSTFPPLLREFDERGEPHGGAIVLVGIRSRDFAIVCAAVQACLAQEPKQGRWRNRAVFASAPLTS